MREPIRSVQSALLLLLATLFPGGNIRAQEPNPLNAVRTDRWADAQAAAARFADPVAERLVLYLRLRAPGAATSSEIADFMQRNPDWPAQAILERRRQEAIAADPDDAAVLAQCTPSPTLAAALLRCAEATANAGRIADADALARQAWVNAIDTAAAEAAFLHRWGGVATPTTNGHAFSASPGCPTRPPPPARSPASIQRTTQRPRHVSPPSATIRGPRRWWPRCHRRCAPIPV